MKENRLYPVYAYHVWEVLAVINCLVPFAERRKARGETSKLDDWLDGFIEKLELLACVLTKGQRSDGIVYLRKNDRELIEKLSNYVKANNISTAYDGLKQTEQILAGGIENGAQG